MKRIILPSGGVPCYNKPCFNYGSLPQNTFWLAIPLALKIRVALLTAIASAQGHIQLCKNCFSKYFELADFHRRITIFKSIPRSPIRSLRSYELELIRQYISIETEAEYYHKLQAELIDPSALMKVEHVLAQVVDSLNPATKYVNIVYKVLSYESTEREEGSWELHAMLNSFDGIRVTWNHRLNFIRTISGYKNGKLWDNYFIRTYCKIHPVPGPNETGRIACKDCCAAYEVKCYTDPTYYMTYLNLPTDPMLTSE